MNKDEMKMIEEMAKIANFTAFDYRQGTIQSKTIYTAMAEALYNANCRIIGEDEIVIKKRQYEQLKKYNRDRKRLRLKWQQAKQETAREILQELWSKRLSLSELQFAICWLAAGNGIELEDNNEQR